MNGIGGRVRPGPSTPSKGAEEVSPPTPAPRRVEGRRPRVLARVGTIRRPTARAPRRPSRVAGWRTGTALVARVQRRTGRPTKRPWHRPLGNRARPGPRPLLRSPRLAENALLPGLTASGIAWIPAGSRASVRASSAATSSTVRADLEMEPRRAVYDRGRSRPWRLRRRPAPSLSTTTLSLVQLYIFSQASTEAPLSLSTLSFDGASIFHFKVSLLLKDFAALEGLYLSARFSAGWNPPRSQTLLKPAEVLSSAGRGLRMHLRVPGRCAGCRARPIQGALSARPFRHDRRAIPALGGVRSQRTLATPSEHAAVGRRWVQLSAKEGGCRRPLYTNGGAGVAANFFGGRRRACQDGAAPMHSSMAPKRRSPPGLGRPSAIAPGRTCAHRARRLDADTTSPLASTTRPPSAAHAGQCSESLSLQQPTCDVRRISAHRPAHSRPVSHRDLPAPGVNRLGAA